MNVKPRCWKILMHSMKNWQMLLTDTACQPHHFSRVMSPTTASPPSMTTKQSKPLQLQKTEKKHKRMQLPVSLIIWLKLIGFLFWVGKHSEDLKVWNVALFNCALPKWFISVTNKKNLNVTGKLSNLCWPTSQLGLIISYSFLGFKIDSSEVFPPEAQANLRIATVSHTTRQHGKSFKFRFLQEIRLTDNHQTVIDDYLTSLQYLYSCQLKEQTDRISRFSSDFFEMVQLSSDLYDR